jgi:hypothetical protein
MLRKITLALLALVLAGCASAPAAKSANPFAPFALQDSSMSQFNGRKAYRLGQVNVSLDQAKPNDKFPDSAALTTLFSNQVAEELQKNGLLAAAGEDAIEVNVDIRYKRVFMGEAVGLNKGFGGSRFTYSSSLVQGGKVFANYQSEEMTVSSGVVGNLLAIGKQLTMTGSAADELTHIATYSRAIAGTVPR